MSEREYETRLPGTEDELTMVRREEQLRVGVERVRTGRVVVRKRLVEEEQTFTVLVRREEVEVIELGPDDDLPHSTRSDEVFDVERPGEAAAPVSVEPTDEGEIVLFTERPVVTMERVPVERVRLVTRRVRLQEQVSADVAREVLDADQ